MVLGKKLNMNILTILTSTDQLMEKLLDADAMYGLLTQKQLINGLLDNTGTSMAHSVKLNWM